MHSPALNMRIRKSQFWLGLSIAVVVAAIALAIFLRKHAAPEPARLLPDGDAIFYVNLKTARTFTKFGEEPLKIHEPETEEFVRDTGIEWVRDLDEAAFSVHGPLGGMVGNDSAAPETRISEVFVGRFDTTRLTTYLRKRANDVDSYRGVNVYSIPLEGRTVRVATLSVDTVAVSNMDGSQDIHGIIDRYRSAALPFGGPSLVRKHYRHVPLASAAWAILKTTTEGEHSSAFLPSGISLFVPANTEVVASVRAISAIHARVELFTPDEEVAKKFKGQTEAFLAVFRAVETEAAVGSDPEFKGVFDNLKVENSGSRAVLSAAIPFGFFKKLLSEPPAGITAQNEASARPTPTPAPAKPKKIRRSK